jgi:hypothetical protein
MRQRFASKLIMAATKAGPVRKSSNLYAAYTATRYRYRYPTYYRFSLNEGDITVLKIKLVHILQGKLYGIKFD